MADEKKQQEVSAKKLDETNAKSIASESPSDEKALAAVKQSNDRGFAVEKEQQNRGK